MNDLIQVTQHEETPASDLTLFLEIHYGDIATEAQPQRVNIPVSGSTIPESTKSHET